MESDEPRIVRTPIPIAELSRFANLRFGDMVKAAVDISRVVMAIGGELHSDEEALLLEDGSAQADIWGINLYPGESGESWIEFDSMINVRPSLGNRSRSIEDSSLQAKVRQVVNSLVAR